MPIRANQISTGVPVGLGFENLEGISQEVARADHVHAGSLSVEADCAVGDVVGDFVYSTGPKVTGRHQVAKVDIADYGKMPAFGVIISKPTEVTAVVQWAGESATFLGLTPRKVYFIGADSRANMVPPSESGVYVQRIGAATSTDTLLLLLDVHLVKRA